jgi:hypothetical protein
MKLSIYTTRALCLLVSAQIAFSPTLAWPSTRGSSTHTQITEFDEIIKSSQVLPPGQPRGAFAPDRFLLLEQEAHVRSRVSQAFGLFSTAVEREIKKHRERLDKVRKIQARIQNFLGQNKFTDLCQSLADRPQFSEAAVTGNIVEYINGESKSAPPFVWDVRTDFQALSCLDDIVGHLVKNWDAQLTTLWDQREQVGQVPNVTLAPSTEVKRWFNWWDVSIVVKSKDGDVLDRLRMKNTADHHSIDESNSYSCNDGDSCNFGIAAGDTKLNSFHLPTRAITVFGPYVVFVHNDSYDAEAGIQYLSFIDLATFGPSIGDADIPVFRLPVVTNKQISSLKVRNKKLILDSGQHTTVEDFMAASELHSMAFNISANLTEPDDIAAVLPYLDTLQSVFQKVSRVAVEDASTAEGQSRKAQVLFSELGQTLKTQLVQNKQLATLTNQAKASSGSTGTNELSEEMNALLEKYNSGLKQSNLLKERSAKTARALSSSRSLNAGLDRFFKRILSPSPNGSLKIKRALVLTGAYQDLDRGKVWSFILDRPWLHTTLISAGLMAAVSPEAFTAVAQSGLALGNGIFDYAKFALLGLGESFAKGTVATAKPIIDGGTSLANQYVADGNLGKTLIGLGAFVPFVLSLYYIPHLIFNIHKIYLDSKKTSWNGLVDHQQNFVREYYERLGADEAKRRKLDHTDSEGKEATTFSPEEQAEIHEFLKNRAAAKEAESSKRGIIGRFLDGFRKKSTELEEAAGESSAVRAAADKVYVKGLWSALMSVTFSYPAMEYTLSRWVRFWNWFAGTRYNTIGFLTLRDVGLKYDLPIFIRPKPITASVRMLFPDFFSTIVAKRGPKLTLPTVLNGGTRTWQVRDLVGLKESILGKPSEFKQAENDLTRELTLSELKLVTENFERDILAVEDAVHAEAFEAAIRRLPEFITDKRELAEIFKGDPLSGITERKIQDLPSKIRTFIRLYFERIYGATMTEYLKDVIAEENPEGFDGEANLTLKQMKEALIDVRTQNRSNKRFDFSVGKARSIAQAQASDESLFAEVGAQARKGDWSISNFVMNRKFNVIGDMDPTQNPSMKRFSVVQERLKSPNALSRAVRSEISKLLVTFPLDLAFKMILTAGIFEGAFKPIQDELWGPNSIFYFSRDSFYMTMAAGFVMGMMADAWVKIQMDARQDDLGDFGAIPKGEDAEKGLFSWFYKQYSAKNNSILSNWSNSNNIAFWNMPAALANIGLFYYMFSGRLDLSLILAGYAVTYGTPLSAFYYKLDQAFERASEYAARGIKDEKWMAHPEVQELVSSEKQKFRNRFQLGLDTYLNFQGNWIHTVEVIPTSYGTRGFARALFGGALLEETIVEKLLRPAANITANIPLVGSVVGQVATGCEYLLTNGNVDLKIKK